MSQITCVIEASAQSFSQRIVVRLAVKNSDDT